MGCIGGSKVTGCVNCCMSGGICITALFNELEAFAAPHPEIERATMTEANRQLITLVNDAISESTGQYARLQQDEAAGHLRDLQRALAEMKHWERRRAELIHQAVHDLRGNVQSVSTVAEVLREPDIPEVERVLFVDMLQQGAEAVSSMMGGLMDLARLEAGHEQREIARFDAAISSVNFARPISPLPTRAVCSSSLKVRPLIHGRWRCREDQANPAEPCAQCDQVHGQGGVIVSLGEEGPAQVVAHDQGYGTGITERPGSPMAGDLKEATAQRARIRRKCEGR